MAPLDKLFTLEIEYHRKLRCDAPGNQDTTALHTSYALQSGYETLLKCVGSVAARDIERSCQRYTATGDPRDGLAARDSLTQLAIP